MSIYAKINNTMKKVAVRMETDNLVKVNRRTWINKACLVDVIGDRVYQTLPKNGKVDVRGDKALRPLISRAEMMLAKKNLGLIL